MEKQRRNSENITGDNSAFNLNDIIKYMAYGASQKNIGKRCYIKTVPLQMSPFFPVVAPFRIIGAEKETYLIEGPWTDQIQWQVAFRNVIIPEDQKEIAENFVIVID